MSTKDVTMFEGIVGIGIDDKVSRNVGVLGTIYNEFVPIAVNRHGPPVIRCVCR